MISFCSLPADLIRVILENFVEVGLQDLAKLAIAFTTSQLRSTMPLILSLNVGYSSVMPSQLGNFLNWLVKRNGDTGMDGVLVDPHTIAQALGEIDFQTPLLGVNAVCFVDPTKQSTSTINSLPLAQFLAHFPCLKVINCRDWPGITDDHIAELTKLACPLEELRLRNCRTLTALPVALVVASFGATLQMLRCEVLDDAALLLLATRCHQLTILKLACDYIRSHNSIALLCSANPHFSELELYYNLQPPVAGNVINDDLFLTISVLCKNLSIVNIHHGSDVTTANSLHAIYRNCLKSWSLYFWGAAFNLLGERRCKLEARDADYASIFEVCATITLPVYSFDAGHSIFWAVDEALLSLLNDRFGEDMLELKCLLPENISDEIMPSIFWRFVNLEKMDFCFCAGLTNSFLADLPSVCPKLTTIGLSANDNFTDNAVIRLLEAYKANNVDTLKFNFCQGLGDATLIKIAELFKNLVTLEMLRTSINKETLLDLIVLEKLDCGGTRFGEGDHGGYFPSMSITITDADWARGQLQFMKFAKELIFSSEV